MRLSIKAAVLLALFSGGCARGFSECRHCAGFLLLGLSSGLTCPGDRVLTIHGAGSTATSVFNPATNTYSAGPDLLAGVNTGAFGFQIPNFGPRACQNVIATGNNTTTGYYLSRTGQLTSFAYSLPNQQGALVIRYGSGTSTRFLIIHGNATPTTIYKPDTDTFVSGPSLMITSGAGVHAFEVPSGALRGKFLIANAGGGGNWRTFDPDTETISAHGAAPLNSVADSNSLAITSGATAGQVFMTVAGAGVNNMLYNPTTDLFSTVGSVTVAQGGGSSIFMATSGANLNQVIIVSGNASTNVDKYNPGPSSIGSAGLATSAPVNAGGHNFLIASGTEAGNRLIVLGNGAIVNVYRHATNTLTSVGGLALSGSAGAGSFSMPVSD